MPYFFDLDDTIYPTRSLDLVQVQGFFDALDECNDTLTTEQLKKAKEEMWIMPIHVVAANYGFSQVMYDKALDFFNREFQFSIKPFDDFQLLIDLAIPLFLITTGPEKLQQAKIKSLDIAHLFREIIIDDPMKAESGKHLAFQKLIERHQLNKDSVLVIGDNPDSEITAAKQLNLSFALVDRENRHRNCFRNFKEMLETEFS